MGPAMCVEGADWMLTRRHPRDQLEAALVQAVLAVLV